MNLHKSELLLQLTKQITVQPVESTEGSGKMMMHILRGVVVFLVLFTLLTVSAEPEEELVSDEELDVINDDEQANEDEELSLDNSVDLQEGQNFIIVFLLKISGASATLEYGDTHFLFLHQV